MEVIHMVITFLIGVIVGYLCSRLRVSGVLKIDRTNPNRDIYRFDVEHLDNLNTKRRIVLKVEPDSRL